MKTENIERYLGACRRALNSLLGPDDGSTFYLDPLNEPLSLTNTSDSYGDSAETWLLTIHVWVGDNPVRRFFREYTKDAVLPSPFSLATRIKEALK